VSQKTVPTYILLVVYRMPAAGNRDMGRVRDRVRVRGLAIAAPSYSGP